MTTPAAPAHAVPPEGVSAWVTIDLDAISDNVRELARRSPGAEVMAVVKADAYGHGLVHSARAAVAGGASWLAVAQLTEALELRAAGVTTRALTWLYAPGADFGAAIDADLDISVAAPWALDAVAAAARERGRAARIHLKVDTGLARNGALGQGWTDLIAAVGPVAAEGAVEVIGVWSHFALADAPQHPTVLAQRELFVEAAAELERAGIRPQFRHLANSAATLTNPDAHFDIVRPGLAVYGLSPVPDLGAPEDFGLREAMRVTARLALVKHALAGQGVSYGHTYTTTQDTTLGLVPVGYADGIPRHAGSLGPVQVDGQRFTIAGRVCMDQFVLDLGPTYAGAAGDEVVILGRGADGEPTAQDWAAAIGTINYEIVTRISGRLPRILVGGGA
ncbi:alanine racemase [Knoellia sinensis KCTC 19936]|uniref:Alanine racemase n=1 Tax=Knoellia sinensis KCTC 19936 TaxID=1385520 RepID=A0A0A0J6M4_9MICO|nr:alanine racemase [Knoellia sinensis]KGN32848.1 alanine racemase [Knoellia sinensis KCTC 19936]